MTIRDIAKAANVSTATVSRILNGKDESISQETKDKVMQIVEESGYVTYAKIRQKLKEDNNLIGVVIPSLNSSLCTEFLSAFQKKASSEGFSITITLISCALDVKREIIRIKNEHPVAIIAFCVDSEVASSLSALEKEGIPVAMITRQIVEQHFASVHLDISKAVDEAVGYLLEENHERPVLMLSSSISKEESKQFEELYVTLLRKHGKFIGKDFVIRYQNNLDDVITLHADAVICQDAMLGSEVLLQASKMGLKVPSDISLILLEDSPFALKVSPSLSAIYYDMSVLSDCCWKMVTQLIKGFGNIKNVDIAGYLVKRESVQSRTKKDNKVLIVGSINMDTTFSVPNFPRNNETVLASRLEVWPGGKGANQAISVSKFGAKAYMLGALGNDASGKILYSRLQSADVNMQCVSIVDDSPTGTAYINVLPNGESTIVVHPGANGMIDCAAIEKSEEVFNDVRYCLMQLEIPLNAVIRGADMCKEKQIPLILKPSPACVLPDSLLDGLFLLIPNKEELQSICPNKGNIISKAESFLDKNVKNVIVTLGEEGCIWVSQNGVFSYPSYKYPKVDTTGASDIFISALTAMLTEDKDMDTAIKMAVLASSYSISQKGVQNSILDRRQLEELYKERKALENA